MTTTLTKSAELEQLDDFIRSLPSSYVKDILGELRPQIESAIESDLCYLQCDLIRQETESRQLAETIAAQNRELRRLTAEIVNQRRALGSLARDFDSLCGEAMTIHRIAGQKSAAIMTTLA